MRAGFGSLWLLPVGLIVLETTGRKTGLPQRIPLLAATIAGHVVVSTVRVQQSQWLRNALEDPDVRYWVRGQEVCTRAIVVMLGHDAGDETLRCFARVMQNTCRSTDFVARLGGDEFGIVAIEADALTGGQIRTRLEGAAEEAKISVSIGMVALSPASDLAEAFRKADGLMYRRKSERLSARAQHQKTGLVA